MSSTSPVATDSSSQRSSDAPALGDRLDATERALREPYAAYLEAVTDRLEALQSLLQNVRTQHAAHRDDLDLDASRSATTAASAAARSATRSGPTDWNEVWKRVCSYRRRMRADVLLPIYTHLEDEPLGPFLIECRATLVEHLQTVVNDRPPEYTRPEPEALFAPDPREDWRTRLQKAVVRTRRRTRSALGLADDSPSVQNVPLRRVVRHRIAILTEQHRPVLNALEDRLLGWLADLERILTSATHTLLEFEQRIDHLDFHHTQSEVEAPTRPPNPAPDLSASLEVSQGPPSSDVLDTVQAEIDALDDVLQDGIALSLEDLRSELWRHVDEEMAALHTVGDQPWPATSAADESITPHLRDWAPWDQQARTRLDLCATMIHFYADVEEARDDLIQALLDEGPTLLQNQLETIASDLEPYDDTLRTRLAEATTQDAAASPDLDTPLREALALVEERLDTLGETTFGDRLQTVLQSHLDALQARVDDLPEEMEVHALTEPDASPDPSASKHAVPVRSGAEVTFDVLFFDQIRSAAQHVTDVMRDQIERAEQVIEVLQFGREMAQTDGSSQTNRPSSQTVPQGFADATDTDLDEADELVRGSLHRSIRLLRARHERVDAAAYQWADTVWHTFRHGMTRLHEQWTTESRFQSRVAHLTRQMAREAREAAAEAQEQVASGQLRLRKWLVQGRRWLDATRSAVRSALGLSAADADAISESVETLASLGHSLEQLPIVYRRLFSFEPVEDPELFKGRAEERTFVEQHVERWRRGIPTSLLMVGRRGSGLTSLLKVVRATTLQNATLHHLRLDARPDSEAQLAAQVARTLNLDLPSTSRSLTLDDVGDALRAASAPTPASESPLAAPSNRGASSPIRACFVEHLEQLLLQTVGGLDLLDRMLTLISRTDAHVLWIGTMSTAAWQLVEKRLPAASELITHEHVDPLSRDAIEDVIMSRHRRSGLDLYFEDPGGTTPLQSRASQADRRDAFFDRLHDESHQNVALALLYWFRSVEPQDDGTGLRVRPLRPISFRVLDELTREQAFALKAFLVHSSLTVAEYSEIAQISMADSVDLIESLGNASLIEPIDGPVERAFDVYFEAVTRNVRYRIRPLLVAPIVQHLKAHNIVH